MDKHWYKKYNDKEYALKQLDELRRDLKNIVAEINSELDEIEKIECGLTKGHDWELCEFTSNLYPMAKPPGMYVYKCKHCEEKIYLKACEKEIWEADFPT